jgi:hypothetical protein
LDCRLKYHAKPSKKIPDNRPTKRNKKDDMMIVSLLG